MGQTIADREVSEIEVLMGLDLDRIRAEWRRVHGTAPPAAFKRDLLLRGLTHRLCTRALGGLDRDTAALLTELATTPDPATVLARRRTRWIKPGCDLLRECARNGCLAERIVLVPRQLGFGEQRMLHHVGDHAHGVRAELGKNVHRKRALVFSAAKVE